MEQAGLLPGDSPWALPEGLTLVVDIETDGFEDAYTRVHSLVARDGCSGDLVASLGGPDGVSREEARAVLARASCVVAHNGFKFDFPGLQRLLGWEPGPSVRLVDTLPLVRLIFADLKNTDGDHLKAGRLPGKLFGSNSIEAWGYRLGEQKVGVGIEDWSTWTPLMQARCESDTLVNVKLLQHCLDQGFSQRSVDLELEVASICTGMERRGFPFDRELAQRVEADLTVLRTKFETDIRAQLRGWWRPGEVKRPERPRRQFVADEAGTPVNRGTKSRPEWVPGWNWEWTQGVEWSPIEWVELNPGSRDQVAEYLKRLHKWQPQAFTDSGKAQVDESVLGKLPWPEAKLLARYFLVTKRLGQLAEGKQAWLSLAREEPEKRRWRIHGGINPNGTVTGRAAHMGPNVGQVPSVKVKEIKNDAGKVTHKVLLLGEEGEWGVECRSMFTAPRGRVLVGADLSKLELLCLAHFLHPFDGGEYAQVVLSGDPHVYMQKAAGVATRAEGKTTNYAFLYGAGDGKLGSIVLPKGSDKAKRQAGAALRARVLSNFGALGTLTQRLKKAGARGYLFGLDGRRLPIRSEHSILNTLLQSAGALIAKRWLVELEAALGDPYGPPDENWMLHAWVHDEVQFSVLPQNVDYSERKAVEAAAAAGRYFKFNVPILAEAKHGRNWAETH